MNTKLILGFAIGVIAASGVAMLAGPDTSRWIVVPILVAGVLGGMAWLEGLVRGARGRNVQGDLVGDADAVALQGHHLFWMVGQDTDVL